MKHDINLNIHYTAPDEVWDKIEQVYQTMPYWSGYNPCPEWKGPDIELVASIEPSGIQIAGIMSDDIWENWYTELKQKLTRVLGYEIGEPEDGYEFKYYD